MLLHIIPRLYVAEPGAPQRELINFHCPDLSMKLRNGIKMGRKAMQGILIETTQRVRQLITLTRWMVGADRVVSHQVQYLVIDDELGAITDSMVLWPDMSLSLGGLGVCWPLSVRGRTPTAAQLYMELTSCERTGHCADHTDSTGRILERCEALQVPTVECECVLYSSKSDIYACIPTANTAFMTSV